MHMEPAVLVLILVLVAVTVAAVVMAAISGRLRDCRRCGRRGACRRVHRVHTESGAAAWIGLQDFFTLERRRVGMECPSHGSLSLDRQFPDLDIVSRC